MGRRRLVAGRRPVELGSAHDGAALQGDIGDLLVASVGDVEESQVRADQAGVAGEGGVEECVGGLGGSLDDGELGAGGDLAEVVHRQNAGPSEAGVLGGVVEGVLGEDVGWWGAGLGGGVA